jgi:hypothetical protein
MCDGLKFESEQGAIPVIQPLLRFPEVWNPTLSRVRAGFRNRLYEGSDHTAEASTPRQCRALAGRCVVHPPHFALLFLSAEPANSRIVGNPYLTGLWKGCPSLGITSKSG